MRSDIAELISITNTPNEFGGWEEASVLRRPVFCKIESVTRAEFFEAAKTGLKPEFRIVVFSGDYNGETECIYNGKTYSIYRTYHGNGDDVELYVEEKAGVTNGGS